jgi:hypothetical protein
MIELPNFSKPNMKRRHFLEFAGSTLAAIGLSQQQFWQQTQRYGRVLAQNTPRKLALLVGINEYPNSDRFFNLNGCVNDVALQKNLLVSRFGFKENDILTLTDAQASRKGIIEAFQAHLIEQAKPGDVVVFHFSGHGSQVLDPSPLDPDYPYNSTFVPADDAGTPDGIVQDIMGQTLFLLIYALGQKTNNITAVLDSCHSGGGTRGEMRVRAAQKGRRASDAEFALQEQLLSQIGLTAAQFQQRRSQGIAAGVAIASAQREQLAADYRFEDFYAGAFTFLLTQYLWTQAGAIDTAIATLQHRIKPLTLRQTPTYEIAPRNEDSVPIYFINPVAAAAQAAILSVDRGEATVWLGGIDPNNLDAFSAGAILTPANADRGETQQLQLIERNGLTAKVALQGSIAPGTLLQEAARAIPPDWKLGLGLDPSLGEDAGIVQRALQSQERIEVILAENSDRPYPQKVHYILSRMTQSYRDRLQQDGQTDLADTGSLGLFSAALEIVPKSFGLPAETISEALMRLLPKLRGLLAARVIKLALNAESSQLAVSAIMKREDSATEILGAAFTARGCNHPKDCDIATSRSPETLLQQIPVNSRFFFEITNNEAEALYLGVLAIDTAGEIVVLFPNQYQDSLSEAEFQEATQVPPNSSLRIPDPHRGDPFVLVAEETGVGEVLIVASPQPMTEALSRLRNLSRGQRGPVALSDPIAVVGDLLGDVSTRSATNRSRTATHQITTASLAALSIAFAVVDGG